MEEGYGEEGSRDLEIEDCSPELSFKLPLVQDTQLEEYENDVEAWLNQRSRVPQLEHVQVCDTFGSQVNTSLHTNPWTSPKEVEALMGQFEDPLRMGFTRASLGYDVVHVLKSLNGDWSKYILGVYVRRSFDGVLLYRRHAKWIPFI